MSYKYVNLMQYSCWILRKSVIQTYIEVETLVQTSL